MKRLVTFTYIVQCLFVGMMLVFWIKFAYLGVLLTNVIQLQQAVTLLSTQRMFVVAVVNLALSYTGSVSSLIFGLLHAIPVGFAVMTVTALLSPDIEWRRKNSIHATVALLTQLAFLLGLAYIMNSFTGVNQALQLGRNLGWVTCVVGLVFALGCVYTLVRLIVEYQAMNSEVQNDREL